MQNQVRAAKAEKGPAVGAQRGVGMTPPWQAAAAPTQGRGGTGPHAVGQPLSTRPPTAGGEGESSRGHPPEPGAASGTGQHGAKATAAVWARKAPQKLSASTQGGRESRTSAQTVGRDRGTGVKLCGATAHHPNRGAPWGSRAKHVVKPRASAC